LLGKNNKKSQEAPPAEKNKNGGEGGNLNLFKINMIESLV